MSGFALSDSKRRAKYGVEVVPHLGIRHYKRWRNDFSGIAAKLHYAYVARGQR